MDAAETSPETAAAGVCPPLMPPVIAPRRSLCPLVAATVATAALGGALGYLVHVWPDPEPFVVPRDRAPAAGLVPMAATLAGPAGDAPRCLAFLDEWVRHPSWQVTVVRGASDCVSDTVHDVVTIDADGDAVWTGPRRPTRQLHLSPVELARLHVTTWLPCLALPTATVGYSSRWYDVRWGGPESPGVRVRASLASAQLDAFVGGVFDAYVARRLAEQRGFRATVALPPHTAVLPMRRTMHVTVDGHGVIGLRVGGRAIPVASLAAGGDLVDVIDWIELDGAAPSRAPVALATALDRATYDAGLQGW